MSFAGIEVVRGVDLDLFPGEVHAIVGENGAGKSTMAKIIAGVYKPTAGIIEVAGSVVQFDNPRQALKQGVALIHQEPLTFPDLDVAENIFVGNQPRKGPFRAVDWSQMRSRAKEMLDMIGVSLDPRARVGNLSVADQQMVELASALSHDAKALMMDETTAALTPKEVAELFEIVKRLKDRGVALAFVSHRLDEVFAIADRITVMRDGEKVGERIPSETSVDEIISLMVGRELTLQNLRPVLTSLAPPILKVENLTRRPLFEDVSFVLRPGEILGLAGLVGAGRTDVCEAIFGVRPAISGSIEIDGADVKIGNPQVAMAKGIALVPEDRQHDGLLLPMSISNNATLASLNRVAKFGILNRASERTATAEKTSALKVKMRTDTQPVRELSGGNQQKVVLGKWLMTDPKILILDEPTRGVDVGAKEEVHRLIRDLADKGMAILMVSSDLSEVLSMSDRVLVMRKGRIVAELGRDEMNAESVMTAAAGQVPNVG